MSEKEFKTSEITQKSRLGFIALSLRSVLTNIFQIFSSYSLAYFLTPNDYGEFGILNNFVGALLFFTDIGLSTHIQQHSKETTREQLASFLGIRLLLALILCGLFIFMAPSLVEHYSFKTNYSYLLGLFAIILPLDVISAVPRITLQRDLNFKQIAKIDLYASLSLYSTQIILAYLGLGVWSFVIANIIRSLVTLVMSYKANPILLLPSLNFKKFDHEVYKKGFFYQLNSIIPTSRGIFLPMLLALFLTIDEIGLIFWVVGLVSIPMIFAYNYNNVFFPALSKVQHRPEEARHLASRAIENMVLALGFIFGLGAALGPSIIELAFPVKWAPAKGLVPLAACYIGLSSIRFLGTSIINAQGLPKVLTRIEISLVIIEYLGTAIFCHYLGAKGYFSAQIITYSFCLGHVYYYIRNWIRPEAIKRFLVVSGAAIGANIFIFYFNLTNNFLYSLLCYLLIFILSVSVLDRSSLGDLKKLSGKLTNRG